jgi:hypothetical protein
MIVAFNIGMATFLKKCQKVYLGEPTTAFFCKTLNPKSFQ